MDLDEVRGVLTQKVAFEQRPEERERVSPVAVRQKSTAGRGKSKCKALE